MEYPLEWGRSGTLHDILTSDKNWKVLQYYYGAVAMTAAAIATGGYFIQGLGAAESAAGSGALFSRAGPSLETVEKLFGEHAEPTLIKSVDTLQRIFPGFFMPRILVTTYNICPDCWLLIHLSGGRLFSLRGAIWPW